MRRVEGLHEDSLEVGDVGGVDERLGNVMRVRNRRHLDSGGKLPQDRRAGPNPGRDNAIELGIIADEHHRSLGGGGGGRGGRG